MVGGGKQTDTKLAKDPLVNYMLKVREEHAGKQERDYSHVFRHKSRFDFIRLSAIIIGIEFAYAAETAFVSPILLEIGINHEHMTMVWGLSPLLGFFLAPLLGSVSDRCQMQIGRRRPIITLLAAGILMGLLLVPYGRELGLLLGDAGNQQVALVNETFDGNATTTVAPMPVDIAAEESVFGNHKFAVILTVLGTILLDFDADTCQTPSRAYLLDVCVPADQPRALSTFTVMAGFGGTLGYALGGIDWESTRIGTFLGGNIPTVFTIVTIVFVLCYIITVTSFREIPLKMIESDELMRPLSAAAIKKELAKNNNPVYYIKETTSLELKIAEFDMSKDKISKEEMEDLASSISSAEMSLALNHKDIEASSSISDNSRSDDDEGRISLGQYLKSIVVMPKSMRILCLVNLLCWMAHLCYCLYFTDFVGEAVFHGNPRAPIGSESRDLYQQGLRYGCWGMSIYAASCSLYSMIVEKLMKVFGTKTVYIGGIMIYAFGMLVLAVWPTKLGVLMLSTTAGVIYATLFTMPYILVAAYHAKGCFKVKRGENVPLNQTRGLGTDIAIVSSMIFIAQLIVSLCIGPLINLIGSTAAVLYAASGLSCGAALAAIFVLYLD